MSERISRVKIGREDLLRRPDAVWFAFVELMERIAPERLAESQRCAHLVFWYDAEVHRGGHRRFLELREPSVPATLRALDALDAPEQGRILERAAGLWRARHDTRAPGAVPEGPDASLEALDGRFHAADPDLRTVLERHLREHLSRFVAVVDEGGSV